MNQHRNTPSIRRRESRTEVFECQPPHERGRVDVFPAETEKVNSADDPSIASGNENRWDQAGRSPTVVGRTPYDFIAENLGGLSSALAGFVRRIRPIVFLIVVAYVLLCIFARPSGPPMSFKALCVLLVGYDLLGKPLRDFFRHLIRRS